MSTKPLADLEAEWDRRFAAQPKLPSSALLTGAVSMACGFGAVMFFGFAWATGFRMWLPQMWIFAGLSLALGLLNRYFARRWFGEVERWSAERVALARELEAARAAAGRAEGNPGERR